MEIILFYILPMLISMALTLLLDKYVRDTEDLRAELIALTLMSAIPMANIALSIVQVFFLAVFILVPYMEVKK